MQSDASTQNPLPTTIPLPTIHKTKLLLPDWQKTTRHAESPVLFARACKPPATTLDRTHAHLLEIVAAAKILGDGHAVLQIEYGMPPSARHEDGIARVLYELVHLDRVAVLASNPRQQVYEVVDL